MLSALPCQCMLSCAEQQLNGARDRCSLLCAAVHAGCRPDLGKHRLNVFLISSLQGCIGQYVTAAVCGVPVCKVCSCPHKADAVTWGLGVRGRPPPRAAGASGAAAAGETSTFGPAEAPHCLQQQARCTAMQAPCLAECDVASLLYPVTQTQILCWQMRSPFASGSFRPRGPFSAPSSAEAPPQHQQSRPPTGQQRQRSPPGVPAAQGQQQARAGRRPTAEHRQAATSLQRAATSAVPLTLSKMMAAAAAQPRAAPDAGEAAACCLSRVHLTGSGGGTRAWQAACSAWQLLLAPLQAHRPPEQELTGPCTLSFGTQQSPGTVAGLVAMHLDLPCFAPPACC